LEQEAKEEFLMSWPELEAEVHAIAVEKGWWDAERNNGEMIALMHSELSETLEALRQPHMSEKIPLYHAVEEELADVIIRIMDFAYQRNYNVPSAILAKIEYNKTRPVKHGGKLF
jgi:NTP pyrophosphatase (non-canonical NTP hydrolase)